MHVRGVGGILQLNSTGESWCRADQLALIILSFAMPDVHCDCCSTVITRFGPKRVAADMEGSGDLIFERFIRIFGDILEDFWTV